MDDLSELIYKAQKGDKDAFGEVYRTFYLRIFRYCKFNTYSIEVAQDICQETFLKAWKALPAFKLEKGGSLQAFLFKIARNLIIDGTRKKKELKIDNFEHLETGEDFEGDLDRQSAVAKVHKALWNLNEMERQIIVLHYFEDMSGAEIAKVVGLREGALRVRTHRILAKLKGIIEENG